MLWNYKALYRLEEPSRALRGFYSATAAREGRCHPLLGSPVPSAPRGRARPPRCCFDNSDTPADEAPDTPADEAPSQLPGRQRDDHASNYSEDANSVLVRSTAVPGSILTLRGYGPYPAAAPFFRELC